MVISKEKVQNIIDHLPDSFQADDLIERLVILQKVEIAQQQVHDGKVITEEEMDKRIDSWD